MTKIHSIKYLNLAYASAVLALSLLVLPPAILADEEPPLTAAADQVPSVRVVPPGFYQFNNLTITSGPTADQAPAQIEVTQKSSAQCAIYEGGNPNKSLPCPSKGSETVTYLVQIDERTTLLGNDRDPAVLSDFSVGDRINILGWVSSDFKTINAAVVRDLESKKFHQTLSGTVKNVSADGFVLVLENGSEIKIKNPIVEGAQVTIKGVFDQANSFITDVISILIKPVISQIIPLEVPPITTPSKAPSRLFKNFLKVFGL